MVATGLRNMGKLSGDLYLRYRPQLDNKGDITGTRLPLHSEVVIRINTHGNLSADIEADRSIVTSREDMRNRRTVKLEKGIFSSGSWGFTLQSYGIYNADIDVVENYSYVDYVEGKSSAFNAGVNRGDVIFAINGQSTEDLSHDDLVGQIQSSKSCLRMVVVNTNICTRIELQRRKQKLASVLRQKQSELHNLEKREQALLYRVQQRQKHKQKLMAASSMSIDSTTMEKTCSQHSLSGCNISIASTETQESFTDNNNHLLGSPDVRPKQLKTSSYANLCKAGPPAFQIDSLRASPISQVDSMSINSSTCQEDIFIEEECSKL